MGEDEDGDDVYYRLDDLLNWIAACVLIGRGVLKMPSEEERRGLDLGTWIWELSGADPKVIFAAVEEVTAMSPAERNMAICAVMPDAATPEDGESVN